MAAFTLYPLDKSSCTTNDPIYPVDPVTATKHVAGSVFVAEDDNAEAEEEKEEREEEKEEREGRATRMQIEAGLLVNIFKSSIRATGRLYFYVSFYLSTYDSYRPTICLNI